jgi:hypothetical protein
MADNLKNRGGQDRQRINVTEDYELQDWSKKFGVSKDQLKEAVQAVGDRAEKVEQYLKGHERSGSGSERDASDKGAGGRGKSGER